MGRDRFREILSHLRAPRKEFEKSVNKNFQDHWIPFTIIVFDETLVRFKGRTYFRRYIPRKPKKTGLLQYLLVDGAGYCYYIDFITDISKLGKTMFERVTDAIKLLPKNLRFRFYADAAFGSEELMIWLCRHRISATIATSKNRPIYLFADYLHTGLKKKDYKVLYRTVEPIKKKGT